MYTILTPLLATSESWSPDLVSLLIRAKADPNSEDKNGASALDWAAYVGHGEAVEYLIRHGATRHQPRFPRWQSAPELAAEDRFALVGSQQPAGADPLAEARRQVTQAGEPRAVESCI